MLDHQPTQFLHAQPLIVGAAVVGELVGARDAVEGSDEGLYVPKRNGGENHEIPVELHGVDGVGGGDHLFVQLFSGTDADQGEPACRGDSLGHVGDAVAWDLGDEDLAPPHVGQGLEDQGDAIVEGDVEAGHALVGDGEDTFGPLLQEEGDDAAAAPHDVAVAHHGELDVALSLEVVGGDEKLVGTKLGGAVKVDGGGRLVGAERHHLAHPVVHGRFNEVLGAEDVGLYRLEGVVLAGGHLFEGRRVHDDIDPLQRAVQPILVAHVSDEIADLPKFLGRELLGHLGLFQLIAGKYHHAGDFRVLQQDGFDEFLSKGTGATGNEQGLSC